ncbi:MAG: T9SS type A sorting domain-containing protein [Cytophagaceae bacterium]|nr:T9SS type A sorting domain-containing protein [Cytophagaceae bacterium]
MKFCLSAILVLLSSLLSFGQVVIKSLEFNTEQAASYQKNKFKTLAVGDTITLPLFDDFATSSVNPDSNLWMPNGGTYINNSYAINPPNFNVATFDGLQANGTPYSPGNPFTVGLADNLTSKPIDLSGLDDTATLCLRFYWQGDGIGEIADVNKDSLRLQFKNENGVWKTMWKGIADSTGFNFQLLKVKDTLYYFNGFQFRFQSFGRLSGSFDVWNVDYIYLDTGRLARDNWAPDLSFQTAPTRILKNYTAMPVKQYVANINGETADTIYVTVRSLLNRLFPFQDSVNYISDIKNNVFIDSIPDQSNLISQFSTFKLAHKVDKSKMPATFSEKIISTKFHLKKGQDPKKGQNYQYTVLADQQASHVDFTRNDSISSQTKITDYYSYDDGSAEFGFGVNQYLGRIALKYTLNVPDTLTHINIYFPRIGTSNNGQPLTLVIWKYIQVSGTNDSLVYAQSVLLTHSNELNRFITYKLDTPVPLPAGIFYVGYIQSSVNTLFTGFDKNIDTRSNIYYKVNNVWNQVTDESGSLMIRPVFGDPLVLGEKNEVTENDFKVFPNPSTGIVNIAGKVKLIRVSDITGKEILTQESDSNIETVHTLDLGFLPDGIYLLNLSDEKTSVVKRIVIAR